MNSYTFGVIPEDFESLAAEHCPFPMSNFRGKELSAIVDAINQGIDSHLEAVFADCPRPGYIVIRDAASLKTFVRRLVELGREESESLASDIMGIVGIEWI